MKNFLIKAIATVFGVGYFPVAPGTAATVVGVIIAYFLGNNLAAYSLFLLVLFGLGVVASGLMEKLLNVKDPSIACIDEVFGVMIALWGLPLMWSVMIIGFFLFRAFDMFKIYPVNKLEALPGGWGIMLDDCMAGVYTNIILRIALRWAGFF